MEKENGENPLTPAISPQGREKKEKRRDLKQDNKFGVKFV